MCRNLCKLSCKQTEVKSSRYLGENELELHLFKVWRRGGGRRVLPSFLGNFRKSKLLLIFAKIFAKIIDWNLCVTPRASLLHLHLAAVQMLNNDRCLGLHLLIHNVTIFVNTETFFTLLSVNLSFHVPFLHYERSTDKSVHRIEKDQYIVTLSPVSWFVALRSLACGHMAVDRRLFWF